MLGREERFESIDFLRGFAALSVIIYHVIELYGWTSFPTSGLLVWFRVGWMGVDLFFAISGFVIGLSIFREIDRSGVKKYRRDFLVRRLARIVPLHYLTIIVFVVFISPGLLLENFSVNLISHLLFFHNFNQNLHGAINGSNWSLAVEVQFYILMLFLAPWTRDARWWIIALVFIGIAWVWRFLVVDIVHPASQSGYFPVFVAATQLPGMLDEFVVGIILARLVRYYGRDRFLYCGFLVRVLIAFFALLVFSVSMSVYWRYASFWDYKYMVGMWRTMISISYAFIILFFITIRSDMLVWKLLYPFSYVGTISYGMYLWHLPVILSLKRVQSIGPEDALMWIVGITLVLSSGSWHFFEKPIINRFRKVR